MFSGIRKFRNITVYISLLRPPPAVMEVLKSGRSQTDQWPRVGMYCRNAVMSGNNHPLLFSHKNHLSHIKRKPAFYICENEGADQLCNNCTADQRLCFRCIDSTIPLLYKSEISSL